MTGYIPPVTLQCLAGKSHCHLSTWLESSSEVWSSTRWRREEDWGPSSKGTLLFLPILAVCISQHQETVLRWTRFFCISDTVTAARTCGDWLAKRGEPLDVCGWDAVGKPIGAPFTWEDTHRLRWEMLWLSCLQSGRRRNKKEEEEKKAKEKNVDYLPNL